MVERLKSLKETLMTQVEGQLGNLENVDTKELGDVIDMVKDISEAEYYCAVTKAMEDSKKSAEEQEKIMSAVMANQAGGMNYYGGTSPRYRYYDPNQWSDQGAQRMYYTERSGYDGRDMRRSYDGTRGYSDVDAGRMNINTTENISTPDDGMRGYSFDRYTGRSPMSRRGFMEAKEKHKESSYQLKKLQDYADQLGDDIDDMIKDASQESKALMRDKLLKFAAKIA